MNYKPVPKKTIKRLETVKLPAELERTILLLNLCREADDELWKELIFLYLDNLRILESKEKNKIKNEIRRRLHYEL